MDVISTPSECLHNNDDVIPSTAQLLLGIAGLLSYCYCSAIAVPSYC